MADAEPGMRQKIHSRRLLIAFAVIIAAGVLLACWTVEWVPDER